MANKAAPTMSANIIHCASREAFASGVLLRRFTDRTRASIAMAKDWRRLPTSEWRGGTGQASQQVSTRRCGHLALTPSARRALGGHGNPELANVLRVAKALGIELATKPVTARATRQRKTVKCGSASRRAA